MDFFKDKKLFETINSYTINKISKKIKEFKCDAIIFSDFRHGIFNKISIPRFCSAVKKNIFKINHFKFSKLKNKTQKNPDKKFGNIFIVESKKPECFLL